MPVVGFLNYPAPETDTASWFRRGLKEASYLEGRNVATIPRHELKANCRLWPI
jgi:hypothetical protein